MKALVKYSKNVARAKMHIIGVGGESSSSWTHYSYGTEEAKLPPLFGEWGTRGSSPVFPLSVLLNSFL